jgi:hypothetical protein
MYVGHQISAFNLLAQAIFNTRGADISKAVFHFSFQPE